MQTSFPEIATGCPTKNFPISPTNNPLVVARTRTTCNSSLAFPSQFHSLRFVIKFCRPRVAREPTATKTREIERGRRGISVGEKEKKKRKKKTWERREKNTKKRHLTIQASREECHRERVACCMWKRRRIGQSPSRDRERERGRAVRKIQRLRERVCVCVCVWVDARREKDRLRESLCEEGTVCGWRVTGEGEENRGRGRRRGRRGWCHQVARIEAGQGQNVVEPSRIIFSASYYCAKHKSVKCLGSRLNETVHRYTPPPCDSLLSAPDANFCRLALACFVTRRAFRKCMDFRTDGNSLTILQSSRFSLSDISKLYISKFYIAQELFT